MVIIFSCRSVTTNSLLEFVCFVKSISKATNRIVILRVYFNSFSIVLNCFIVPICSTIYFCNIKECMLILRIYFMCPPQVFNCFVIVFQNLKCNSHIMPGPSTFGIEFNCLFILLYRLPEVILIWEDISHLQYSLPPAGIYWNGFSCKCCCFLQSVCYSKYPSNMGEYLLFDRVDDQEFFEILQSFTYIVCFFERYPDIPQGLPTVGLELNGFSPAFNRLVLFFCFMEYQPK